MTPPAKRASRSASGGGARRSSKSRAATTTRADRGRTLEQQLRDAQSWAPWRERPPTIAATGLARMQQWVTAYYVHALELRDAKGRGPRGLIAS